MTQYPCMEHCTQQLAYAVATHAILYCTPVQLSGCPRDVADDAGMQQGQVLKGAGHFLEATALRDLQRSEPPEGAQGGGQGRDPAAPGDSEGAEPGKAAEGSGELLDAVAGLDLQGLEGAQGA